MLGLQVHALARPGTRTSLPARLEDLRPPRCRSPARTVRSRHDLEPLAQPLVDELARRSPGRPALSFERLPRPAPSRTPPPGPCRPRGRRTPSPARSSRTRPRAASCSSSPPGRSARRCRCSRARRRRSPPRAGRSPSGRPACRKNPSSTRFGPRPSRIMGGHPEHLARALAVARRDDRRVDVDETPLLEKPVHREGQPAAQCGTPPQTGWCADAGARSSRRNSGAVALLLQAGSFRRRRRPGPSRSPASPTAGPCPATRPACLEPRPPHRSILVDVVTAGDARIGDDLDVRQAAPSLISRNENSFESRRVRTQPWMRMALVGAAARACLMRVRSGIGGIGGGLFCHKIRQRQALVSTRRLLGGR